MKKKGFSDLMNEAVNLWVKERNVSMVYIALSVGVTLLFSYILMNVSVWTYSDMLAHYRETGELIKVSGNTRLLLIGISLVSGYCSLHLTTAYLLYMGQNSQGEKATYFDWIKDCTHHVFVTIGMVMLIGLMLLIVGVALLMVSSFVAGNGALNILLVIALSIGFLYFMYRIIFLQMVAIFFKDSPSKISKVFSLTYKIGNLIGPYIVIVIIFNLVINYLTAGIAKSIDQFAISVTLTGIIRAGAISFELVMLMRIFFYVANINQDEEDSEFDSGSTMSYENY